MTTTLGKPVSVSTENITPASEGGDDSALRYGVQFDGLTEADHIFVRGFVFEQLASRAGVVPQFASAA